MMPLEIIGVLGILYCFFMYCTLEMHFVKKNSSVREEIRKRRLALAVKIRESRPVLAIANLMAALSRRLAHRSHAD